MSFIQLTLAGSARNEVVLVRAEDIKSVTHYDSKSDPLGVTLVTMMDERVIVVSGPFKLLMHELKCAS